MTAVTAVTAIAAPLEPIVIGQVFSIGAGADGSAQRVLGGSEAYVGYVNANGGVQGRKIKLISADGGADPKQHAEQARLLITKEKAVALINCVGAPSCDAIAAVANELKVPLIGTMTGASSIVRRRNDFVFAIRPGYAKEADAMARQLRGMGTSKLAILTTSDGSGERVAAIREPLTKNGIAFTVIPLKNTEASSVTAMLAQLQQGRFNAVLMDVGPDVIDALIDQKTTTRPEWPNILAGYATSTMISLASGFRGHVIAFSNVVPNPEAQPMPLTFDLLQHVEKYSTGLGANFEGMEAYINTKVCIEGLRRASGAPDPVRLASALRGIASYDLGGFVVSFTRAQDSASEWVDVGMRSRQGYYLK